MIDGLIKDKDFYLSPQGRVCRKDFWLSWVLPAFVASFIVSLIDGFLTGGIIALLFSLALIWPGLVIGIKRCHDRGKSGWFLLIGIIPIIGWIWLFVELYCLKGQDGENQYGPDPLAGGAAAPAAAE